MNQVILIGRLTADPETKLINTANGQIALSTFCLAVRKSLQESDFFNCESFDKMAKLINEYCKKGDLISIVGRLRNDKFVDKDGKNRVITKIVINGVEFLSKNSKNTEQQQKTETEYNNYASYQQAIQEQPYQPYNQQQPYNYQQSYNYQSQQKQQELQDFYKDLKNIPF